MRRWWTGLSHDGRVFALAFAGGLPAVLVSLVLLWAGAHALKLAASLTALVLVAWLGCAAAARVTVVRPLQSLANLLAAIREGDFSLRSARARPDDALGTVMQEVNALAGTLRAQRLGAVEASALLHQVMAEIDVAILAFDDDRRLRLANAAAERLAGIDGARAIGLRASELGMNDLLDGVVPRTEVRELAGGRGPWEVRRAVFRQEGRPHHLVVLSDLRRALREEEQQAWRRLVRVLGHEINNSLAPIRSLTQSLSAIVGRADREAGWEEDVQQGLAIVGRRAESLGRFMGSYTRLARLPPPRFAPTDVGATVQRVVALEKRLAVEVITSEDAVVDADADQLEQVLINLVKNAVEAALEGGGHVAIAWHVRHGSLELSVRDDGPGLPPPDNLFVLFFTTKPEGSGIGLVLSRQVAEAHGGSLTLENRSEGTGCVARLLLPAPSRRAPAPLS